jgi:hypothetical protein
MINFFPYRVAAIAMAVAAFMAAGPVNRNLAAVVSSSPAGPPPLPTPNSDDSFEDANLPRPDIQAFHRAVDQVDRVRISAPAGRLRKTPVNIELTDVAMLDSLKRILKDKEVTPSFVPPEIDISLPIISAYRENKRLFLLVFLSKNRFELMEADDKKAAGGYQVSDSWYQRYIAVCRNCVVGKQP